MNISKRAHLRAPIFDEVVYVCDDYVLKGRCENVSEGGALFTEMSRVPDNLTFPILIPLVQYPEFSKLSPKKILSVERSSFDLLVVRAVVNIVRSFKGKSEVEKILMKSFGAKFVSIEETDASLIKDYVTIYAKNIVHLLSLFESHSSKGSNIAYLRKVASLLGYDGQVKLSVLRQSVLHDYQSIVEMGGSN